MASAIAPLAVPVSFATVFIKNLPSDGRAYPVIVHRSSAARIRVITRSRVHRTCAQGQVRARICARRIAPPGPWDFVRWHCAVSVAATGAAGSLASHWSTDRGKVAAPTVASPGPSAARPIHYRRPPAPRHHGPARGTSWTTRRCTHGYFRNNRRNTHGDVRPQAAVLPPLLK